MPCGCYEAAQAAECLSRHLRQSKGGIAHGRQGTALRLHTAVAFSSASGMHDEIY